MKRLLSLVLAAAMVLSLGAMTVSAADIKYPVAFVWNTGFLKDDNGVLQIGDGDGVDEVPYGSTVYFPLINTNYNNHNDLVRLEQELATAKANRDAARTALDSAKAALQSAVDTAQSNVDSASSDVTAAQAAVDAAQSAYDAARNNYNSASSAASIKTALNTIADGDAADYAAKKSEIDASDFDGKISNINTKITTWEGYKTTLNGYKTSCTSSLTAYYAEDGDSTSAEAMMTWLSEFNTREFSSPVVLPSLADYTGETLSDAITAVTTALDALIAKCDIRLGNSDTSASTEPVDSTTDFYQWRNYYNARKTAMENELSVLANKIKTAIAEVNTDYGTSYDTNTTSADTIRGWANSLSTGNTAELENAMNTAYSNLASATSALAEKNSALADANTALTNAQNALTNDPNVRAKQTAYDNAEAAVTTAQTALNNARADSVNGTFVFVTESAAVSNAKVKADWDYGSKYVQKIELDKVSAVSNEFGMDGRTTKIYCIAVTIKESSTTNDAEIEGEIGISKSGSNGYSLSDTAADISLNIVYPSAGSGDMDITAEPQLFSKDYGFEAEEDHIFYFAEDDDSRFEVNTKTQKDIVLAFDTDYDDDIADDIYKKNPKADLDFYNGNYAKFSKTGTLWLGYPEEYADDAYVYAISTSGKLSLVNADYDEYEEAFEIRTNTLGRYVISTEKLKLTSSSSTGTTSSSGTGTVTSSKSSTTTAASSTKPVSSSTPASSSSKPVSSSAVSSQVSSQESSLESSSSSEPLSIKEPSSEDENAEVSGTVDPKDEDVPTKKGGVSWIVWLLILAGLVAVVVAVGVIFYTKKNSGRRML